jgi:hypothetical protein
MPEQTEASGDIEECVDKLGEFIATLTQFPAPVLAFALRVHLQALLRAALDNELCTAEQAREFLRDLQRDVLQAED